MKTESTAHSRKSGKSILPAVAAFAVLAALTLCLCGCVHLPVDVPQTTRLPEKTENTDTTAPAQTETAATAAPTAAIEPLVTEPKATEPKPTEPAPTEPIAADDGWKAAYLKYLQTESAGYIQFALVYVDGDDIPELYMSGDCEATGDAICAYRDGAVVRQYLRRIGGGDYIPGSGLLINTNGNMGYYTTHIFRLEGSGFTCLWEGLEAQEYQGDHHTTTFTIGERVVSEAEYYAAIHSIIDTEQTENFYERSVSIDEIRKQIENG